MSVGSRRPECLCGTMERSYARRWKNELSAGVCAMLKPLHIKTSARLNSRSQHILLPKRGRTGPRSTCPQACVSVQYSGKVLGKLQGVRYVLSIAISGDRLQLLHFINI